MKMLIYKTLQKYLRKLIDWLLTIWVRTNEHIKELERQKR